MTDYIFSRGNSEVKSAVIALLFSIYGRKIKESADI